LTVTGVTRKLDNPPASLGTADLPAMWPGLPRGEEPPMTFQANGGWPVLVCDLVVALEPVGQNTQSANYAATVAMLDNLSTALRGANIGRGGLRWSITANAQVDVSGTPYWAVIATIEGR
ncbi:MAG: hypothetical protein WC657_08210, partial [Candidatus Paceibacterota bacterium]